MIRESFIKCVLTDYNNIEPQTNDEILLTYLIEMNHLQRDLCKWMIQSANGCLTTETHPCALGFYNISVNEYDNKIQKFGVCNIETSAMSFLNFYIHHYAYNREMSIKIIDTLNINMRGLDFKQHVFKVNDCLFVSGQPIYNHNGYYSLSPFIPHNITPNTKFFCITYIYNSIMLRNIIISLDILQMRFIHVCEDDPQRLYEGTIYKLDDNVSTSKLIKLFVKNRDLFYKIIEPLVVNDPFRIYL